ncbi:NirD/YgiW/YdeI family stress tolerance protein [Pseudodesulfovibrio piezophilus]|uniref:Uncharacterized protein n=1 Tax=Pseudodesulfovibrio piezophilus (strain DSM 21447 / JCM 15486 / C1TLV30) TaxID=1322246 RepID=M1WQR1_PSEP2|nr:NirD/YgiW/YdeI family stress tolerance protein [Pseudodesulfovibrio piezophilus]CCH47832.1 conserved exported protein of unknown function [Pseudodesulfovibrio piezophilus C1TLV30]
MKTSGIFFVLFLMISAFIFSSQESYAAGPYKATSVAEAKVSGIDTSVVLNGHFVRQIKDNEFLFADNTGELLLYVNDAGIQQAVNEKNEVQVEGMIVQNFMYTEVQACAVNTIN